MIKIEKNQIVPENPNLRVLTTSGEYSDNELVTCSTIEDPDFALCAFSASFIKYGPIVNQFNDPLELGEALLKLDPDCTHDTAILFKEEEIRKYKREKGDFSPENPIPFEEKVQGVKQEKTIEEKIEEAKENIRKLDEESVLSGDNSTTNTPVENSTTTSPIESPTSTSPTENSTSTPVIESPNTQASSTESAIPNESIITPATSTPSEEIPVVVPPLIEEIVPSEPLTILKRKSRKNIA